MSYRPEIEGLRAVALALVVLFHASVPGVTGGYVGVDVFFVISGYLICGQLARRAEREWASSSAGVPVGLRLPTSGTELSRFYLRRMQRLAPALVLLLLCVVPVAALVLVRWDWNRFAASTLGASTFTSNFLFWKQSRYFDAPAEFFPLLHTWSLGVEAQFYLLAPFLFAGLEDRASMRRRLAAISAGSLALCVWLTAEAPGASFYLLPTRLWEMLLGGLVALQESAARPVRAAEGKGSASGEGSAELRPRRWAHSCAGLGLAGIVAAGLGFTEETGFPGAAALLPCGGTALLLYGMRAGAGCHGTEHGWVKRVLSAAPLVAVGQRSYSLYLWHWPWLALAHYALGRVLHWWELGLSCAVGVAGAVLSYRHVERPFRASPPRLGAPDWRRLAGALALVVAGTAAVSFQSAFWHWATGAVGRAEPFREWRKQEKRARASYSGPAACFLSEQDPPGVWSGKECFLSRGKGFKVLLWGDSYAAHYVPGLLTLREQLSADILQYTATGCPPILGFETRAYRYCPELNQRALAVIDEYAIDEVVLVARWEQPLSRDQGLEKLEATLAELSELGVRVVLIGQSPRFGNDVHTLLLQEHGWNWPRRAAAPIDFDRALVAPLRTLGVPFVDPLPAWCGRGECVYLEDGKLLFWDDGHYSLAGSRRAVRLFFPHLRRPFP